MGYVAPKKQKAAYFLSKDHVTFTTCQFGRKKQVQTGDTLSHSLNKRRVSLLIAISELVNMLFGIEQHLKYTRFLTRPARKKSDVPKVQ